MIHMFLSSKRNERSVNQLIKYMIDVAMGMHYIMERGLVHRVSVSYPTDFGIVRCTKINNNSYI